MQTDISPLTAPDSASVPVARETTKERSKSKLAPVKLDSRGRVICKENGNLGARVAKWRVTFGKKITGGKKERNFFDTEKEAKEEIAKREELRKKEGKDAVSIPAALREEALRCNVRLKEVDAALTLSQAVDYYLNHNFPKGGRKNFREITEQFLKDRAAKGCREKTLKGYQSFSRVLAEEWGEENIHEIKQEDIEDWLSESPFQPRTRANYLMTLNTIFGFALKRKYCVENPAAHVSRPILDDKPVGILTPAQARALLDAAKVHLPEMVAGLAIGLFAGLRVSELCALDWSEIDLSARLIEVKAAKAKTRQRRLVTISDNLALWLAPYVQRGGPVLYRLTEADDDQNAVREVLGANRFGKDLRWLVEGSTATDTEEERPAVVNPWPHNAIRHSFGSYYFGRTKNENATASEMGNSPAMVYKHYRELVKPADVVQYWNILPAGEAVNVLPMLATA